VKKRKDKKVLEKSKKRSERRKYLDTMMADMGISSLNDLSSNQERAKWLKAVTPSRAAERKMKEMGYDISGNNNIGSLGRRSILREFLKVSSGSGIAGDDLSSIRDIVGPEKYRKLVRFLIPNPFERYDPRSFSKEKKREEIIIALSSVGLTPGSSDDFSQVMLHVDSILNSQSVLSDSSNPSENIEDYVERVGQVSADDMTSFDRSNIKILLEDNGVMVGHDRESIRSGIMEFQAKNDLAIDGIIDIKTMAALGAVSAAIAATFTPSTQGAGHKAAESIGDLRVISISENADLENSSGLVRDFILELDKHSADLGMDEFSVTSAHRSPDDQSRIMFNNFERTKETKGPASAREYFVNLYNKFPRHDEIADIYASERDPAEMKSLVSDIVSSSWNTERGHLGGLAIDISGLTRSEFDAILDLSKRSFDFRSLWEPEPGAHYHISVRSKRTMKTT